MNLEARHQTGAVLLMAALQQLFPSATLHSGGGSTPFLFCDCEFPFPVSKEVFSLLEERVRLFLKNKGEIEVIEMMTEGAITLFLQEGKKELARQIAETEGATVSLVRVENSLLYLPHPFSPISKQGLTPYFRLTQAVQREEKGKKIVRFIGFWEESKEDCKKRVKEEESRLFHEERLDKEGFAFPFSADWVWLEKGEMLRKSLAAFWKKRLFEQKGSFLSAPALWSLEKGEEGVISFYLETLPRLSAPVAGTLFIFKQEGVEGLFLSKTATADRLGVLCSKGEISEKIISYLQFILQIPKILGFEFEIFLSVSSDAPKKVRSEAHAILSEGLHKLKKGFQVEKKRRLPYLAQIEVRLQDGLGRLWTSGFLALSQGRKAGEWLVVASLYHSLERMIALFLEKEKGSISCKEGIIGKLNEG